MKKQGLPWDEVDGGKYYARELKPRKQWVTVGSWILSVVLILAGIFTHWRIAAVFGVLYILTLLMQKDTAVTSRGLEIYYQMRVTTSYTFWPWSEISMVTREDKNHPEVVALYITRGDRTKRLYFTRPDAKAVMDMARKQKPRVIVGDAANSAVNVQTGKTSAKKRRA